MSSALKNRIAVYFSPIRLRGIVGQKIMSSFENQILLLTAVS